MSKMYDYRTIVVGTDGSPLAVPTVARAAWLAAHDDAGAIIAAARYAAWPGEPGRAEIAFEVADAWHGRGIGTALASELVAHARSAGLTALTASTLSENQPARALLVKLGFRPRGTASGVVEYELDLTVE